MEVFIRNLKYNYKLEEGLILLKNRAFALRYKPWIFLSLLYTHFKIFFWKRKKI